MDIIDISPLISDAIGVWPGDTPYSRDVLMSTDSGDHMGLSKVTTTLHLGAHTDAPNHYVEQAAGIDQRSLHFYYGPCQVIECDVARGERIQVNDLSTSDIQAPRVLLKTGTFSNPDQWNDDFAALSVELVEFLSAKNVLLVGIDTPSVDLFHCKELLAHKAIHQSHMAILEGVVLDTVLEGQYTLCALPLKLKDADASPVRAVLLPPTAVGTTA